MNIFLLVAAVAASALISDRLSEFIGFPRIAGYILTGIFLGPFLSGIIAADSLQRLKFIIPVTTGFVGLTLGRQLGGASIAKTGIRFPLLGLIQSTITAISVAAVVWLVTEDISMTILLSVVGISTAPTALLLTFHHLHVRGPLSQAMLTVTAVDDVLALGMYLLAAAIIPGLTVGIQQQTLSLHGAGTAMAGGLAAGILYWFIFPRLNDHKTRGSLVIGATLLLTGSASVSPIGPLLSNFIAGAVLGRIPPISQAFWHRLEELLDMVYMSFFVYLGAAMQITLLPGILKILFAYVAARGGGKYLGARLGALLTRTPSLTGHYLGLSLLPQGGVALIITAAVAELNPHVGELLLTVTLIAAVISEIVGALTLTNALKNAQEAH